MNIAEFGIRILRRIRKTILSVQFYLYLLRHHHTIIIEFAREFLFAISRRTGTQNSSWRYSFALRLILRFTGYTYNLILWDRSSKLLLPSLGYQIFTTWNVLNTLLRAMAAVHKNSSKLPP